ncbi:hypothetical protein [Amycolatopsis anabasis]|uniref:hypothetical protein n=1 Tax=Amycolatopsis anabasis TaxID=1840409 RepID=UPI00131BF92A|nr:hypothetical protein [Amycolatopsis anabasis]
MGLLDVEAAHHMARERREQATTETDRHAEQKPDFSTQYRSLFGVSGLWRVASDESRSGGGR